MGLGGLRERQAGVDRIFTAPLATTSNSSSLMASTSSRFARCSNSNCQVANSEPFFIRSMMSNGGIGPDAEP